MDGLAIFTLADAVKLGEAAKGKPADSVEAIKAREALKGGYLHTDESAIKKQLQMRTGDNSHWLDNPQGVDSTTGLPGGKLPSHTTYSNESPYDTGIRSARGGEWIETKDGWGFKPSDVQLEKGSPYMSKLLEYYVNEKGNGIDSILLPGGKVIK